jgi:uncharacterized protein
MTLEERINSDLKDAMRAKDQAAMRTIRSIKSAIMLLKTDGSGDEITEDREIKLLQKLLKQRKDSLTIFEAQNREDLAATEREEVTVIERYLPAAMGQEELDALIKNIISETGATSAKDMGKVIGAANKQLAGQAEGAVIAATVKRLLS